MDISTSGVHFSLVTINVGNLWEAIAGALTRKKATWIGVSDYTKALTNAVSEQKHDGTLYVSVGTGDFLTPWIRRLYAESVTDTKCPRIQRLIVKHIDLDKARGLEALKILEPRFVDKLQLNIETLQSDLALKSYGIEVEVRHWPTMPFFHGYLVGKEFLIGHWQFGHGGQLHVRTPLFKSSEEKLPSVYKFVKEQFEEAYKPYEDA